MIALRMDPETKGRWVSTHPWDLWETSAISVILRAVWRCQLIMWVQTHYTASGMYLKSTPWMWRWIYGMSPRNYPVTHSFGHQFLTMVKIGTSRAIKPILFPGNQPDALREGSRGFQIC